MFWPPMGLTAGTFTKVTSSQERKETLQWSGRYFNCLKTNHKSQDCDSRKTCRYCHQKHHQSICSQANSQDNKSASQSLGRNEASQSSNVTPTNTTTTTTNSIEKRQTVLSQTAQAMASRDNNGSSIPVRVLFDSGSQLSYITERLQEHY